MATRRVAHGRTHVGASMELIGFDKLQSALAKLPDKYLKSEARKSSYEAMQPILHAARSKVPIGTGQLASSLKVTGFRSRNWRFSILLIAGNTENLTGDDIGHLYKGKVFYAGMVEWGHRIGHRSLGSQRREVVAMPFLRPALDEQASTAMRILAEGLLYSARAFLGQELRAAA